MRKQLLLTFFFLNLVAYGVIANPQQKQPRDVISLFCQLDMFGRRLTPAGAKELAKVFQVADSPSEERAQVVVIRTFSVRPVRISTETAEFAVDYRVLGYIDSSLGFTPVRAPYSEAPLLRSDAFSLVLTDTHLELQADGRLLPVKGLPEWKIKIAPQEPHVSLMAALGYVRTVMYRSKTPVLKARAQRTLTDLEVLFQLQSKPVQVVAPSQQMPQQVLSQFVQMQMDGTGLTTGDPERLEVFLVHPFQWQHDKIGIAKAYGVKGTGFNVNKADAYVEYSAAGELDSKLNFIARDANEQFVRQNYKLVFDNNYSFAGGGASAGHDATPAVTDSIGPSRWRIEDGPAEQWISVAAAIRYVTETRDTTGDPVVKANAEKTLTILSSLR